ncbi:hypothetical protein [Bacillus salacetis]|uniref:hypothetical protein n=1 Tax=Bacillus salacetis TaxID=2315464 RepID=UPI001443F0A5|nr:hypothetical protein [Bacillus salacetis]
MPQVVDRRGKVVDRHTNVDDRTAKLVIAPQKCSINGANSSIEYKTKNKKDTRRGASFLAF